MLQPLQQPRAAHGCARRLRTTVDSAPLANSQTGQHHGADVASPTRSLSSRDRDSRGLAALRTAEILPVGRSSVMSAPWVCWSGQQAWQDRSCGLVWLGDCGGWQPVRIPRNLTSPPECGRPAVAAVRSQQV